MNTEEAKKGRKTCVYLDPVCDEFLRLISKHYEVSTSTAIRVCIKLVMQNLKRGLEDDEKENG